MGLILGGGDREQQKNTVPTDSNSRADFIEAISKNVVLIEAKE